MSAVTLGVTALHLGANAVTGVIVARALGADGRGELTAILVAPSIICWLVELGCGHAAAYHQARAPRDGGRLIATWLAVLAPLGVAGVLAGELVLPTLLAAQSDATLDIARLYMVTVPLGLLASLMLGVLLGDQDFQFVNLMRLVQPGATIAGYCALWGLGALSVGTALGVIVVSSSATLALVSTRALRRHGLGRPDRRLARASAGYGLRAHGTNLADLANVRLDLLIMPAILVAASVGLYAVAVHVAFMVSLLTGALAGIVLPASARRATQGGDAHRAVLGALHLTLALGTLLAAGLAVFGGVALRLVYGPAFEDATLTLRILLPGAMLYGAALVLIAGLNALNRPLSGFVAQAGGLAVTVLGLLLFLESGGIVAAAIVSSVAYTVVFGLALLLYRRRASVPWVRMLPRRTDLPSLRPRLRARDGGATGAAQSADLS